MQIDKKTIITLIIGFLLGGVTLSVVYPKPSAPEETSRFRSGTIENFSDTESLYTSPKYAFSLTYPRELIVNEFDEGNDSATIVFQEPSVQRGFQIFVTPYGDTQVTEERLRKDIRSGDIREPVEIVIGKESYPAFTFLTYNTILGESREVWFIRNGYLYQVTTYIEHDAELATILSTLSFSQ